MKRIIVLLLVIWFLVGTCAAADELEEHTFQGSMKSLGDSGYGEELGNPAPCGGGGDGGPPTPG